MEAYIVGDWAMVREGEIVDIPEDMAVHPDFLRWLSKEEFLAAFRAVRELFLLMYADIAADPDCFGLPTIRQGEYSMGPVYNDARIAADRPFYLLMYLFAEGCTADTGFAVDIEQYRGMNKGKRAVRNVEGILEAFTRYGFVYEGLKGYSIPRSKKSFIIRYPANSSILSVLHDIAQKCAAHNTERNGFTRFRTWNYRLAGEPRDMFTFGGGAEHVADSVRDTKGRSAVHAFHDIMMDKDMACEVGYWHEGPFIRYFEKNASGAYLFEIMKNRADLTLRMRIRDAEACFPYLADCPESIKELFRHTDNGCDRRKENTCVASTRYIYEGEEKWRCGCWGAPFFAPLTEAYYSHYVRLVEIGRSKARSINSSHGGA